MQTEEASQLLTILVQKIHHLSPSSHLLVEPRSLAIAKRGDCTFVQKARTVQAGSAQFGIVVNSGRWYIASNWTYTMHVWIDG